MPSAASPPDPMTSRLGTFRQPETTGFGHAWVGMEPTFATKKSVRKWREMSETPQGEDGYFKAPYMLRTQRKVARALLAEYRARRKQGDLACMFAKAKLERDVDQWGVERQSLILHWAGDGLDPLEVRFGIDPEVFEYSIKPVPLAWFFEERFVRFLQEIVWAMLSTCRIIRMCACAPRSCRTSFSAKPGRPWSAGLPRCSPGCARRP